MHGGGGFSGGHHGGGFGGHHHSGISQHHHHQHKGDGTPGLVWAASGRRRPSSGTYSNGSIGMILGALLVMAALTCVLGAR